MITTDQQPDLFTPRPMAAADDNWLEVLLLGAEGWMTARDIMQTNQGRVLDRDIREIASTSRRISSGQRGYKHIKHATAEEVNHSASWLISQGKKMIRRGIAQRNEAHKIFG